MNNWINQINDIIIKERFGLNYSGNTAINEIDVILSLIQSNLDIKNIDVEMRNVISLISNVLERLGLLLKEILNILNSFVIENKKLKTIKVGEKYYYYNKSLDAWISEDDYYKLEESYRRGLQIFKQLTRKLIYLIIAGEIEKKDIQNIQNINTNIQYEPIRASPENK